MSIQSVKARLCAILVTVSWVASYDALAEAPAPASSEHAPQLTKPPQLAQFVEATYPEAEKAAGRTASVVLQIAISSTGSVDDATVLESAGAAFDAAALAAVRRFVFTPAEIDGKPAAIRIKYRYEFVLKAEAPTTASFEGLVRERGTAKPLAGVSVELEGGLRATTDEQGHFALPGVSAGKQRVVLVRQDLKAMQTEEVFEAGQKLSAVYEVDLRPPVATGESEDDMEIVIVAPTLTKQVVSTKVEADQAKRVAGTQGDVLKIVENMPGVARATAGSGQIVVWGAAPQDTRVYVDGVRVPLLYHFGGLRSVVHTDLVKSVELFPGGYGATYGRGLGGLISVETKEPNPQRLEGSAELDLLDASVAGQGRVTDKIGVAVAARHSHLDWVLGRVSSRDTGDLFPIPRYTDAQARARYRLAPSEWIELSGLLSSDAVSRTVASADPNDRKSETRTLYFDRLSLHYKKENKDGSGIEIIPWLGRDRSSTVSKFGAVPTEITLHSMNYGVRASWYGRVEDILTGSIGLDLEATSSTVSRFGSISTPPREGDVRVFGQSPSDQINSDKWSTLVGSPAPYAEGDLALFDAKLHVVPGVRIEPFFTSVNRRIPVEGGAPSIGADQADISIQPRLSVRYAPSSHVSFKAAYGSYRQAPAPEDLSSVFGNPLLGTSQAQHWLVGGSFSLSRTFTVEPTLFYSKSDKLVVRNPISEPLIATALVNQGQGRSYGAQLLLRRELANGLFGWVAYTLLRSERLDQPGANWRLFDFDQTHVLTALASYQLGLGFDVGARLRYATGYPRTPVIGAYYDARRGAYEPILGEQNSDRLPAFLQLDLRLSKTWKISTSELEVYADVQNVTDRANPEEVVYSADYSEKRFIRGLPILPVIGARWSL